MKPWLVALIAGVVAAVAFVSKRANAADAPSSSADDASLGTLPDVPGLRTREAAEPGFVRAFLRMCRAEGCSQEATDRLAGIISEESGFNPAARNPIGAVGFLQWIPQYAKAVSGFSPDELAAMSGKEQLAAVQNTIRKVPAYKTDPGLAGWGHGAGQPDVYVLAQKGEIAYTQNAVYDRDGKGSITAGDVRRAVYAPVEAAKGKPRISPSGPGGAS